MNVIAVKENDEEHGKQDWTMDMVLDTYYSGGRREAQKVDFY